MVKSLKNDKSAGRHLKKIFLPNKKHYSVVSDGIRNFLAGGPVNLFLTSPPTINKLTNRFFSEIAPFLFCDTYSGHIVPPAKKFLIPSLTTE